MKVLSSSLITALIVFHTHTACMGADVLSIVNQIFNNAIPSDPINMCVLTCPGEQTPIPVRNSSDVSLQAGCGPFGIQVPQPAADFTACCQYHDQCYTTCQSNKTACDSQFQDCMNSVCLNNFTGDINAVTPCFTQAVTFYNAVHYGGCPLYLYWQRQVCACV